MMGLSHLIRAQGRKEGKMEGRKMDGQMEESLAGESDAHTVDWRDRQIEDGWMVCRDSVIGLKRRSPG